MKLNKYFIAGTLSIIGTIFLFNNTNATNVPNANITRSYYHQSIGVRNNESVGSQNIPYTAITYEQGVIKRLYGIVASTVPNDTSSDKYKTISVNFTITQENYVDHNNNSLHDTPFHYLYVTAGGQEYQIECSVNRWINNTYSGNSYTCNGYFSNYERITAISVRAGIMNADTNTIPLGTVGCSSSAFICNSGNIKLDSFTYTITSSADPLIQGQQELINGQKRIENEIKDLNNTITDSTINGNFSLNGIQPFGPIGTITTSILELPRIILNVDPCQEVEVPLPYVEENNKIIIPCPSVILNQMAGEFINMLDAIASAGIWFITGRYIFKKVQNLRDPTNEDEEYLDL